MREKGCSPSVFCFICKQSKKKKTKRKFDLFGLQTSNNNKVLRLLLLLLCGLWPVVVAVVVGSVVVVVANVVVVVAIQAAVSKHGSAQTHFMLSPKNTYNYNGILPKSLHTHTHAH